MADTLSVPSIGQRREPILIPISCYTSADYHAREMERLWPRVWQLACREEDLPRLGDYYEYVLGDQSVLLVRNTASTVKAYFNVCLHRGSKLKTGGGSAHELRCPFHGWVWNLDGTSKEVVDVSDFAGIEEVDLCLPECQVDTWGGFVFINMDPAAESLNDYLGSVPERLAAYNLQGMVYADRFTTVLDCNWKIGVEAFVESYHVQANHPQQLPAVDDVTIEYESLGPHGAFASRFGVTSQRLNVSDDSSILEAMINTMLAYQALPPHQLAYMKQLRDGEAQLPPGTTLRQLLVVMNKERAELQGWDISGIPDSQILDAQALFVFPNLVLSALPGEVFMLRFRPNGNDHESFIADVIRLRFPGAGYEAPEPKFVPQSDDPQQLRRDWGSVLWQDFFVLPKVQAGMHVRTKTHNRLNNRQESLIANFHSTLAKYL